MPLDVDNGIPVIELWFGRNEDSKVGLMCHLDSCATMNIGNLRVYQWLITAYHHLVAEYIQYNDATLLQSLLLPCTVNTLEATESMHGKLIAIVWYWLRYADGGKPVILSFGLGSDVAVNSIICKPTLRQWGDRSDFFSGEFSSCLLHTKFSIHYEPTKQDVPHTVQFLSSNFVRPLISTQNTVRVL